MESNDKRDEVLTWMRTLTLKEFAELFYEAAPDMKLWNFEDEVEAQRFADINEHLILSYVELDERTDKPIYWIKFIGLPDAERNSINYPRDANLSEEGKCECEHQIISWTKQAICPLCGRKVHLT